MSQENTRLRTEQTGEVSLFRQIKNAVSREWQLIRQTVTSLVKEGIEALLFAFDGGTDSDAPGEEERRRKVCEALRAQFGNSPAEVLRMARPEEREQLAAQYHVVIAKALGIEESVVTAEAMDDDTNGSYSWTWDVVALNSDHLYKQPMTLTEAKNVLGTILHETYHSFQRKAIVRPSKYGVEKAEAKIWRINFQNYIQVEQNPERYWTQPIEVTARMFSAQVIKYLYE